MLLNFRAKIKHIDVLIVFFVTVVIWIEYLPQMSTTTHKISSDSSIFADNSLVLDQLVLEKINGSNYEIDSAWLYYLYAPWDAKSIRYLHDIELFISATFGMFSGAAINCWSEKFRKMYQPNSFPKIIWRNAYFVSNTRHFHRYYELINKGKHVIQPVASVSSCHELQLLMSTYDFIVLGRMDMSQVPSILFKQFHEAATEFMSSDFERFHYKPLFHGVNIIFAIMPLQNETCLIDTKDPVSILFRSLNISVPLTNATKQETWKPEPFIKEVLEIIESHMKQSYIFFEKHISSDDAPNVDINARSPIVLFFTNSRVSPLPHKNTQFYSFKALQIAYATCPSVHVNSSSGASPNSSTQRHLWYQSTLKASIRDCRLTRFCPVWWRATLLNSSSDGANWQTCGLNRSYISPSDRVTYVPAHKILENSLKHHPYRKELIDLAAWLMNTKFDVEYILARANSPPAYLGIDDLVILGHMHQYCCEFAVNQALHATGGLVERVQARALRIIKGNEALESCIEQRLENYAETTSSADGLICTNNRSLTFASVSRTAQPSWMQTLIGPVSKEKEPFVAIIDSQKESVFLMRDNFSYANLAYFIAEFHQGNLPIHLASQPVKQKTKEETNSSDSSNLVHARNASHFETLIGRLDRNVVVLYYGRHCAYTTHGRGAVLEFRSTAAYFAQEKHTSLLFVLVDVAGVQLPWYLRVEHVPTIILFPINKKSYSSVFPETSISSPDFYLLLIEFLRQKIDVKIKTTEKSSSQSCYLNKSASNFSSCPGSITYTLENHLSRTEAVNTVISSLILRLEFSLNEVNSEVTALLKLGDYSLRSGIERLEVLRDKLTDLWWHFVSVNRRFKKEYETARSLRLWVKSNRTLV